MHELVLVMLLLFNGPDGRLQTYGPITEGVDGEVMTFSSHTECSDFGTQLMDGDDKLDGFVCVVKPKARFGLI